jgi:RNA polymerase sigma factor (sigma-70 family)
VSLPPSTQAIVTSAQENQPNLDSWFEAEVHPHEQQLKSFLRGSFPAVRDVEDVVQESYVRLWKRQVRAPVTSAKNFLFRIARNLAVDILRRDHRNLYEPVNDLTELRVINSEPDAADAACMGQEIELMLEAIKTLPTRCREVFILRKLQGLSQQEIAERMGISEATVQIHAYKGLQRCQKYLIEHGLLRSHLE